MSLVILTKSPVFSWKEFVNKYKIFIKFLLGQKRGPDSVVSSLLKGLKELNFEFKYNVKAKEITSEEIVYINGSVEALKWAISEKKKGNIKKLIVGPVMVILPDDENEIICDKNIDRIVVPSQWVKNLWLSIKPNLAEKILIWPAGTDVYLLDSQLKNKILIYQKNAPVELLNDIKKYLIKKNTSFEIIKYGFYKHDDYLSNLNITKAMIFLSESESQGLAMCEAWMKNVPTLVWSRGFWQHEDIIWKDEKISAPYLSDECGIFFADLKDFENKWSEFLNNLSDFQPRKYAEENFTNKKITENFLKILQ